MLAAVIILSALLPGIVVLGLLRVTFNAYVAPILTVILTIMLLTRLSMPWYTIVIGIFSVGIGFLLAKKWSLIK
ncbi:uncharacterized protein DUF2198 [Scopulibacillus darangshiensis]|uniref:Uncharacterized protein DUF2198 n=1 Tax=Scopulibacillus darangshiensis TaxID=442528 RepID=A0A4R2NSX4_9BACL|nr:DUF2198 family protein [Scopulibacillus darangshiensis]TCP24892.1 uncharacterized protein DUF2198 [Scopulibacillus darangshiensis]